MLGLKLKHVSKSGHFFLGFAECTRTWHFTYICRENNVCTRVANCLCAHDRLILVLIDKHENNTRKSISNGNIFRVTGLLCGEFTGPGEFPTQRPVTRNIDVFFDLRLINGWVYNREAGDLRRHRGHYDVSVMISIQTTIFAHWRRVSPARFISCRWRHNRLFMT